MSDVVSTKNPTGIIVLGVILLLAGIILSFTSINSTNYRGEIVSEYQVSYYITIPLIIIGSILIAVSFFIIVKEYERGIILRWGKYTKTLERGIGFRIPFVDQVFVVDTRERVRKFNAEEMLTKDNVPIKIDSIIKYKVDKDKANEAVLNVEEFDEIIEQSSQTALRTSIGKNDLQSIISKRGEVNKDITEAITEESKDWGIIVTGVEVKNLLLPKELEHAMSMQAQAEREKLARITYGDSEIAVAEKFQKASSVYKNDEIAYALRQSNLLFEAMKAKSNTVILVPSDSLNQIGFGNLAYVEAMMKRQKKVDAEEKLIKDSSLHTSPEEQTNKNKEEIEGEEVEEDLD